MLIYLVIYIPFILCAYFDFVKTPKEQKNNILWFWVIVFTLFRGLRWEIGTDWQQFYQVYQHAEWSNIFSFSRDSGETGRLMDYGYMFINTVFNKAGLPYTAFLLATNFWIMWCYKDFSERHTKYPILTMILLLNVGVPFPVRQSIALATSFWGYRFAVEKKWRTYAIVAILAALIHKGSLIGLIIIIVPYIVEKWRIKWWGYAIAYVSTFIISEVFREYIVSTILFVGEVDEQLAIYGQGYIQNNALTVDYGKYNVSALNGLGYSVFFALLLWIREKHSLLCNLKIRHFETFFFMYVMAETLNNLVRTGGQNGLVEILGRITRTIDMFPLIFPLIFTILLLKYVGKRYICCIVFCLYMCYKYWQQIPGSFYQALYIPYKSILGL